MRIGYTKDRLMPGITLFVAKIQTKGDILCRSQQITTYILPIQEIPTPPWKK